jgi:VWFA-related protein
MTLRASAASALVVFGWMWSASAQSVTPAPPSSGQAPAPAPDAQSAQQPDFRTEANFVLADAFVTRDGKPVTDLALVDFELREDGVLQTIRSFERVGLGPGTVGVPRRNPSTVAESNAAVADPRRRVFVLFLDTFHVSRSSSMELRGILSEFLDRVIGENDLIALAIPQMAAGDVSFSSDTRSIRDFFQSTPIWGVKDELPGAETDETERELQTCFTAAGQQKDWEALRPVLREHRTLQALTDLTRALDGMREQRKAIIVVTEGWQLFKSNERRLKDSSEPTRAPGRPPIVGVGPDGRMGDPHRYGGPSTYQCDTLRLTLAAAETSTQFRSLIGEANRATASFYTIDAARLRVSSGRSLSYTAVDSFLESRNPDTEPFSTPLDTIEALALGTNGRSVTNTNDVATGLRQVAEDFNFYYLLGYNSTNTKSDGKFRRIAVTVKKPGVEVRARQGYMAARGGRPRPSGGSSSAGTAGSARPEADLVATAISRLADPRAGAQMTLFASAGVQSPGTVVRVVAELAPAVINSAEWRDGAQAQVQVKTSTGVVVGTAEGRLEAGNQSLVMEVPVNGADAVPDLRVQMRLTGSGALARFIDTTSLLLDGRAFKWGAPIVSRRGPSTGLAYMPTADLRFRRQERVRVECGSAAIASASLVDRRGNAMNIPVTVRPADETPSAAEVSLAPLAAGDYALLLRAGGNASGNVSQLVVPFRVIP